MSKKKVKEEPVAVEEDVVAEEGSPTAEAEAELAAAAEASKPDTVVENVETDEATNLGDPEVSQPPAAAEPAEDAKDEAPEVKAAPPTEPDVPAKESEEVEEDLDFPGVVTKLSKEKFLKLRRGWIGAGKPRRLNAFGRQWLAVDDGTRFVDQGAPGGMGDYGSLSTSSLRK